MEKRKLFLAAGFIAFAAICWMVGVDAAAGVLLAMPAAIAVTETPEASLVNPGNTVTTDDDSKGVFPEQSVTLGQEAAPEVYEPQYDKLITKVRIARTPLDQITRSAGKAKKVSAMEFKYGSVDYLPVKTTLSSAFSASQASSDFPEVTLNVANAGIFNRRDLIIVQGVSGYNAGTNTQSDEELKLWVKDRNGNSTITVIPVNGRKDTYDGLMPASIAQGTTLIRIGKACAELDSQAPGYAIFPKTAEQYCQKFMAQVEQSTIDALTAKRFDNINLSDQEEATLADMRLGMEGVFLFGTKSKFIDPETMRNVWTTQGIWSVAGKEFTYSDKNATYQTTEYHKLGVHSLIDICRDMFTGPAAGKSNRRVVLCGSELLGEIQKVLFDAQYTTNVYKKWDLEFTEFASVFGKLEFILAEVFDIHGHAKDGLIIDPDYIDRYYLEPFGRNTIDFNAQGTRDSKAIVLREISAVVMKSPKNHARMTFVEVPAGATETPSGTTSGDEPATDEPASPASSDTESEASVTILVTATAGYGSSSTAGDAAIDASDMSAAGKAALKAALADSVTSSSAESCELSEADYAVLEALTMTDYFTYTEDATDGGAEAVIGG